jgi:histidinol-phosphate/aromatic aminotransferase/cobyric acid decarboxylase-like protein
VLRRAGLELMSSAAADGGSALIIDEAYAEYAGEDFAFAGRLRRPAARPRAADLLQAL